MKKILAAALAALALVCVAPADTPKEPSIGTIAGTAIARGEGWLGIELRGNCFRLTFYDAKKHPVAADASSAVLRWNVRYQPNPERTELTASGDPAVLASSYSVKPPHSFTLHIVLLFDGKPDTSETYTVAFSG